MTDLFVQARWYKHGRIRPIRGVCVHCTATSDSARGAEGTARYFETTERQASAHWVGDSNSGINCVHESDTAYAAKGVNADMLHAEIVGREDQTEAQWLDRFSLAALHRAAAKVAYWCRKYAIPARYLTLAEIKDGKARGLTFHADVSKAIPSTGHTDPGPHFPRAKFLDMVKAEIKRQDAAAPQLKHGWGNVA